MMPLTSTPPIKTFDQFRWLSLVGHDGILERKFLEKILSLCLLKLSYDWPDYFPCVCEHPI